VRASGIRHELIETSEFDNPLYIANNADPVTTARTNSSTAWKLWPARVISTRSLMESTQMTLTISGPGIARPAKHRVSRSSARCRAGQNRNSMALAARGLSTWDRPASACLSSRVPYGTTVTPEADGKNRSRGVSFARSRFSTVSRFARTANLRGLNSLQTSFSAD